MSAALGTACRPTDLIGSCTLNCVDSPPPRVVWTWQPGSLAGDLDGGEILQTWHENAASVSLAGPGQTPVHVAAHHRQTL